MVKKIPKPKLPKIKRGQGGKPLGSTTKRAGDKPTPPPPPSNGGTDEKKKQKWKLDREKLLEVGKSISETMSSGSTGATSSGGSIRPGGKSGASFGAIDYKNEVNTDPTAPNIN